MAILVDFGRFWQILGPIFDHFLTPFDPFAIMAKGSKSGI